MKIIIGLGNPGEKYQHSRHNAGWIFLDSLVKGPWKENKRFQALVHETDSGIILAKPLTFMNNSGISVRKILDYYGLLEKRLGVFNKPDQDLRPYLTVIQDELDVDFGQIKTSVNSGSAGHRGIESIISHLKTKKFTRLRIGIKNDLLKVRVPADKFVLQNFSNHELNTLKEFADNYSLDSL